MEEVNLFAQFINFLAGAGLAIFILGSLWTVVWFVDAWWESVKGFKDDNDDDEY